MIKEERLIRIVKLVDESKNISVKEIAKKLNSAESTIRSDLNHLNNSGLIKRVHGGACSIEHKDSATNKYFENRLISQISEKKIISKKALNYINNNESIAIDGSTTCYELAKLIDKSNLKLNIITNSIIVAQIFQNNLNITTTLVGGIVSKESFSTSGKLGIDLLDKININTFFFSASSVDYQGFTDFNIREVELKKSIIEHSQNSIALMDNSKFNSRSLANICSLDYVRALITDNSISKDLFNKYSKLLKELV